MRLAQAHIRQPQRGFSLVELLLALAILAILAGLLRSFIAGMEGMNQQGAGKDLNQLTLAQTNCRERFKVAYLPSKFILCEQYADYPATVLGNESKMFLQSIFPGITRPDIATCIWNTAGIDWNGNGAIDAGVVYELEGDQCLVFFLGGIPAPGPVPGVRGFSDNPKNPADFTGPGRIGPFFEFQSSRLVNSRDTDGDGAGDTPLHPAGPGGIFFSYLDTFGNSNGAGAILTGQAYAYFSRYKTDNSYNRYPISDCATLNAPFPSVVPYFVPGRYHNASTCQIISAGQDFIFGVCPAGGWTQVTAGSVFPPQSPGADDLSNFYDRFLGLSSN